MIGRARAMRLWWLGLLVLLCLSVQTTESFVVVGGGGGRDGNVLLLKRNKKIHHFYLHQGEKTSTYEDTDPSSKGVVSILTNVVNFFSDDDDDDDDDAKDDGSTLAEKGAPSSVTELLERIRGDYTERNYLWTGDIDLACYDADCTFTDPTLSFQGRDKFVSNVRNLGPILDAVMGNNRQSCRSKLLSISIPNNNNNNNNNNNDCNSNYIESRWNMVGELNRLPWKPRIDVIGRTKFWYKKNQEDDDGSSPGSSFSVYFYDECWEIPAFKALLQLVTPAGTIPNQ